jgi:hypothetical protein
MSSKSPIKNIMPAISPPPLLLLVDYPILLS